MDFFLGGWIFFGGVLGGWGLGFGLRLGDWLGVGVGLGLGLVEVGCWVGWVLKSIWTVFSLVFERESKKKPTGFPKFEEHPFSDSAWVRIRRDCQDLMFVMESTQLSGFKVSGKQRWFRPRLNVSLNVRTADSVGIWR